MGKKQLAREVVPKYLRIYCSLCVLGSEFQLIQASLMQMFVKGLISQGINLDLYSTHVYTNTHVSICISVYIHMCVCSACI